MTTLWCQWTCRWSWLGSNDPSNQSKQTLTVFNWWLLQMPVQWSSHMTEDQSKCLQFPLEVWSHFHLITDQLAPTCQFSYKLFLDLCLKSWRPVAYFIWNSFPTCPSTQSTFSFDSGTSILWIVARASSLLTLTRGPQDFGRKPINHPNFLLNNVCFSFSDLCYGKDFELMGSDKICTALCSYRCIVCPSVSSLSLPLTKSSNSEKNAHIWSWFFPLLCSHSWIISYDLKWYKTSVVFTTVFHWALLTCRWQRSWIVSSVWILAPWLWLSCWLQDI
jgi:hypothetical protein